MLIDSHCHLFYDEFKADLAEVLQRASDVGVGRVLSVCTKLTEIQPIATMASHYVQMNHSVGVHPHHASEVSVEQLERTLEQELVGPKVVALGETGLDYFYENSPKEAQKSAFKAHIRLAKKYDLPLIVHTRDADEDTIELLSQEKGKIRGVIHCFSGTQWLAKAALDLGFYISVSGIATFKNSAEIRRIIAEHVPLDRLLVETDSPYLAPLPHRGKRNEPSFVIHVADALAAAKSVTLAEISAATTENYLHLFGWKD